MEHKDFTIVVGDEIDVAGEVSRIVRIEDDPLLGRMVTLVDATRPGAPSAATVVMRMDLLRMVIRAFVDVTAIPVVAEVFAA